MTTHTLQELAFLGPLLLRLQRGACRRLEDFADSVFGLGRALEVRERVDLVAHRASLLDAHRLLLHLHQLALRPLVVAQITLVADQDDRHVGTEVLHLRRPLLRDVLQAVGTVNGKAHEDNVGVGVGQRPETVVVFLTCRVPQRQLDLNTPPITSFSQRQIAKILTFTC